MTDAVSLLDEEVTEGMQNAGEHDHDEEEHKDEYDEHVWTSPDNASAIVKALGKRAAELFPENADSVTANADSYAGKINELDAKFAELLSGEERYFIFGDRFPLLYFFRHYGLNYYAAFPGCGSETEPSAQTMTFLLDKLRAAGFRSGGVLYRAFKQAAGRGPCGGFRAAGRGVPHLPQHFG